MSCCCCNRRAFAPRFDQLQDQAQFQDQDQDQDQKQKNVFKEIGNVNIEIDNKNIAVAILAMLYVLLGGDSTCVKSLIDRMVAKEDIPQ